MLTNIDRFRTNRRFRYRWLFLVLAFCSILIRNRAVGQTKSTSSAVKHEVAGSETMPPVRGVLFLCNSLLVYVQRQECGRLQHRTSFPYHG